MSVFLAQSAGILIVFIYIKSVDQFGENCPLNNVKSPIYKNDMSIKVFNFFNHVL